MMFFVEKRVQKAVLKWRIDLGIAPVDEPALMGELHQHPLDLGHCLCHHLVRILTAYSERCQICDLRGQIFNSGTRDQA